VAVTARMPGTLLAAIATPRPVPQTSSALSACPLATSRAGQASPTPELRKMKYIFYPTGRAEGELGLVWVEFPPPTVAAVPAEFSTFPVT
jgi:hypothetical protein